MSVQSWYDRDVSDVAGLLAEEHVARTLLKEADLASSLRDVGGQLQGLAGDAGKRFSEFSQNFGPQLQEYGGKAMEWLNDPKHQAVSHGLVGAGLGGLLGAGSQLFRDEEDRQYGSSALHGALAGGALGGGIGLARQSMGGLVPGGKSPETTPAEQPAAGAQPPAATQAGGDNIEQQIAELNRQIETATQGQRDATTDALVRGGVTGAVAAPASSAAMWAVDNTGANRLRRGAQAADRAMYSADEVAALNRISTQPDAVPLGKAVRSSRFGNPLQSIIDSITRPTAEFTEPGVSHPIHGTIPGQTHRVPVRAPFWAEPAAKNTHIPGLTNAQVRELMRNGRRGPTWFNRGASVGIGLLPLIMALAGQSNVDNAEQQLANTLSGGQN